jgi:hypothetical protein
VTVGAERENDAFLAAMDGIFTGSAHRPGER